MQETLALAPPTPRLRGVVHTWGFVAALAIGLELILTAGDTRTRFVLAVYAAGMASMFGASALYHRGAWAPHVKARMQRLDHSTIYLAIAGTYTPIAVLALSGWVRPVLLAIVWGASALGIALCWVHRTMAGNFGNLLYVVVGWAAVLAVPQLVTDVGVAGSLLLLGGGLCYTVGAVILFTRWPDPWPRVFGYHEVWHVLTVVAAGLQLLAIGLAVLPRV